MKTRKIFTLLLVPVMTVALTINCSDEEAITTGIKDVSSRVTGYTSEITGAGAPLTITGTGFDRVQRVVFGTTVVPAKSFIQVNETSLTFPVPSTAILGETDIFLVFPGNERAFAPKITVVPLQVVNYFDPAQGPAGTTVTVYGANLEIVNSVKLGTTDVAITGKSGSSLQFTVPASATSGKLLLGSGAGTATSVGTFTACDTDASNPRCLTPLNNNGGFENATVAGGNGGNWFFSASGTRATYEIINSPGGAPDLGTKTLKATVTSVGTNNYDIQIVNDGYPVPAGKKFRFMGRIWANGAGRQVRVVGGVSVPGFQDMAGGTTLTLTQGWNEFSIEIQHNAGQQETQIRAQVNFSYPANAGAVFYFDDFRVVAVGDR
jgi:hypothetical protein